MINFKAIFCAHKWKKVSFDKTGKMAVDWALNIRPERNYVEQCEKCSKERQTLMITLADKPIK